MRRPASDEWDPKILQEARHLFIVKQLKRIWAAEQEYFHKYPEEYAQDFETLIKQGFLPEGVFEASRKYGYKLEFHPLSARQRQVPAFQILASPDPSIQPDHYFSVGPLGLVRFGESEFSSLWGPSWDYSDHTRGPLETLDSVA